MRKSWESWAERCSISSTLQTIPGAICLAASKRALTETFVRRKQGEAVLAAMKIQCSPEEFATNSIDLELPLPWLNECLKAPDARLILDATHGPGVVHDRPIFFSDILPTKEYINITSVVQTVLSLDIIGETSLRRYACVCFGGVPGPHSREGPP